MRKSALWPICLALSLVILPNQGLAQVLPNDNVLNAVLQAFQTQTSNWIPAIRSAAMYVFWSLAAIDFTVAAIRLGLSNADLTEWAAEIVRRVLFIGLFLAFILNAQVWAQAIIDSLARIANTANAAAGGGAVQPDTLIERGIEVVWIILDGVSFWNPGDSIALIVAGLAILYCFARMGAELLMAYVEVYLIVNAGFIVLGLGGASWTSDFAVRYWIRVLAAGLKVFALVLMLGLSITFITGWVDAFDSDSNTSILVIFVISFVMLTLTERLGALVDSLLSGASASGPGLGSVVVGTVGKALAAVTAGKTVGAYGVGAASAVTQAAQLSGQQGHIGVSRVGGTFSNLAGAARQDLAGRLGGIPGYQHGTVFGRMARDMREKRLRLEDAEGTNNILAPGAGPGTPPPAGRTAADAQQNQSGKGEPGRSPYISPLNGSTDTTGRPAG